MHDAFGDGHDQLFQSTRLFHELHHVATFVHDQPNPTLGVGGSGDVLGGVIAAFIARGLGPLAAACAGVWVHGRAGALLASEIGESGALATDIADAIPRALRQVLGPS